MWADKTFKEKKVFYKQRQRFFDAVKCAKNGERPVITYKGERYVLFSPDNYFQYADENRHGFCVMFHKKLKHNVVVSWHYGNKSGWTMQSDNYYCKHDWSRLLCFAEKINTVQ
ncbi:MAG: hypothetical protein ACI9AT_000432 [Ulvibacter sp.]|jgi:hypothetical protein